MLVIARKNGQKLIINDNIEITIVDSKNGSCRLAIKAPSEVKIYREEVYMQIKYANLVGQSSTDELVAQVDAILKNSESKLNTANTKSSDGEFLADNKVNKRIFIKKRKDDNV